MLQSIDHHYLRLADRFENCKALDPAAMHRRELVRLLRQERRARWSARRLRLRDLIIRWWFGPGASGKMSCRTAEHT